MKLAQHYSDKPATELPMLFQRILANCTMDWFRKQKAQNAVVSNLGDFDNDTDAQGFDFLERLDLQDLSLQVESPESALQRAQKLQMIEYELQELPPRQREAFLLRYWEELDLAETASAMGCSPGSVKTHCWRAIQALAKALKEKGITV